MREKVGWLRPLLGLLAAALLLALIFGRPQIWQYLENWLGQGEPSEEPDAPRYYLTLQHVAKSEEQANETNLTSEPGQPNEPDGQIELEEAVVGFVAAEMPAGYAEEALAAQAVAARSYAWHKQLTEGQVCDNSAHCLAYLDEAGRRERWGKHFAEYEAKIRQAVSQTAGLVLTKDGEVLPAYFHAACGGMTESPANGFGGANLWPAAACYWEADSRPSSCFWPKAELAERLQLSQTELPLLYISASTPSGRVKELRCGANRWSGAEFRQLLGLPSSRFSWLAGQEGFWFTCQGFGHGVGLCQQGCGGLAAQGADWRQILSVYYPGCQIENLAEVNN